MTASPHYRIDRAETPSPLSAGVRANKLASAAVSSPSEPRVQANEKIGCEPALSVGPTADVVDESWLGLQAADLIEKLQSWEQQLSAREAQLNVRAANQDQRERNFRLQQQSLQKELDQQQRALDRIRSQVEAQARRLAFETR